MLKNLVAFRYGRLKDFFEILVIVILFLTLVIHAAIQKSMNQLPESLFLFKRKHLLLIFLFLHWTLSGFSRQKEYNRVEFKLEMQKLAEQMIVDISKANETLRSLDKKYADLHNAEINYNLTIKKIKFFSSYGDYARVKFLICTVPFMKV